MCCRSKRRAAQLIARPRLVRSSLRKPSNSKWPQAGSPPTREVPNSCTIRRLPPQVVQVAPQYKGYHYFATAARIAINDPPSRKVVALLPYSAQRQMSQAAPTPTKKTQQTPVPSAVTANASV